MLKIEININGSAYSEYTDNNKQTVFGNEIARQLRILADKFDGAVFSSNDYGSVNDINGNKTLTWELDIE